MKIVFFCDSGANCQSCREEVFDVEELDYTETEWRAMTDEERYEVAREWANDRLDIGCYEQE